jgi:hypothetical protein
MEDIEAKVIDEAIKYIQSIQQTGVIPVERYPVHLEEAVKDYLKVNGETLDTY